VTEPGDAGVRTASVEKPEGREAMRILLDQTVTAEAYVSDAPDATRGARGIALPGFTLTPLVSDGGTPRPAADPARACGGA
jgi:hypothetical protein